MNNRSVMAALSVVVLTLLLSGPGCIAVDIATSEEGADVTAVKPQSTREEIEEVLGPSLREWENKTGVRYCIYEYDGGYPGHLGGAIGFAIADIITLGMTELMLGSEDLTEGSHEMIRIVVSYDTNGRALGVFKEFEVLPEDGRSLPETEMR